MSAPMSITHRIAILTESDLQTLIDSLQAVLRDIEYMGEPSRPSPIETYRSHAEIALQLPMCTIMALLQEVQS